MFGVSCPECDSYEAVIIGIEREKKKKHSFFCSGCGNKWADNIPFFAGNGHKDMEANSILLGFEIFEVAADCSVILEHSCEENVSVSEKEKCLKGLKYLQGLLAKRENEWGLSKLKKVLLLYNRNVEWGIKELDNLSQLSEGKIKEEVEKIIKYLKIVKRTKT